MSVREKLRKKDATSNEQKSDPIKMDPRWVAEGTSATKILFKISYDQYKKIKSDIEDGKITQSKNQWLIRSKIATEAGYDRSLINSRRQPELCSWLDIKNEELTDLFETRRQKKPTARQKSKRELEKQITNLRKEYETLLESDRRHIVESYFNSNVLDDRDSLRIKNQKLKIENDELFDKNARLQKLAQQNEDRIEKLMQILTAEQRALLLWDP
ncbi:MAG: hypothetical protein L0J05_09955 [Tetragenococcus halophilus]|nr:hypothetical protein [Tetragenococcus halophilus]